MIAAALRLAFIAFTLAALCAILWETWKDRKP